MTVRTFGIAGATETAESFRLATSGMWVPASALNTRTGVTSVPVLTGTGAFTCTVSPFTMVIDGTSNSLQGSYPVALDTTTLVTITAADVAARTDLICVQIQDNPYDASGQSRGQILYVKGTSGGGVPATPANSIVLWQVPVGASASSVTFASATAVFPYTAAAGGIVFVRGATDKPAAVNGVAYRHRGDVGAGGVSPLEWSTDGTTWTPVGAVGPQLISTVILGSTTASMSINVPAGFTHLQGIFTARGDAGSGGVFVVLQLNGDTGSNYIWQESYGLTASTVANNSAGATNAIRMGIVPGGADSANYFGTGTFHIGNINSSVFKPVNSNAQGPASLTSGFSGTFGGQWLSTSAVTSVKLLPSSGASNFVAGSSFSLYGMP